MATITFQEFAQLVSNSTAVIIDNFALSFPYVEVNEAGKFESVEISYNDNCDEYENIWDDSDIDEIIVADNQIHVKLNGGDVHQVTILETKSL
jgi:hypothetical protein